MIMQRNYLPGSGHGLEPCEPPADWPADSDVRVRRMRNSLAGRRAWADGTELPKLDVQERDSQIVSRWQARERQHR